MTADERLTLVQIAGYLGISESDALSMVKEGVIPGDKGGEGWTFRRILINEWLCSRIIEADHDRLLRVIQTDNNLVPLPLLISPERIIMNMKRGSREDILKQLVKPLESSGLTPAPQRYLRLLQEREEMVSTAIKDGVATPHVREQREEDLAQNCIVFGSCPEGTDYGSLDGRPTHIFFLICAKSTVAHLRLLAKISYMLRKPGTIRLFTEADCMEDVVQLLIEAHYDMTISF